MRESQMRLAASLSKTDNFDPLPRLLSALVPGVSWRLLRQHTAIVGASSLPPHPSRLASAHITTLHILHSRLQKLYLLDYVDLQAFVFSAVNDDDGGAKSQFNFIAEIMNKSEFDVYYYSVTALVWLFSKRRHLHREMDLKILRVSYFGRTRVSIRVEPRNVMAIRIVVTSPSLLVACLRKLLQIFIALALHYLRPQGLSREQVSS